MSLSLPFAEVCAEHPPFLRASAGISMRLCTSFLSPPFYPSLSYKFLFLHCRLRPPIPHATPRRAIELRAFPLPVLYRSPAVPHARTHARNRLTHPPRAHRHARTRLLLAYTGSHPCVAGSQNLLFCGTPDAVPRRVGLCIGLSSARPSLSLLRLLWRMVTRRGNFNCPRCYSSKADVRVE